MRKKHGIKTPEYIRNEKNRYIVLLVTNELTKEELSRVDDVISTLCAAHPYFDKASLHKKIQGQL